MRAFSCWPLIACECTNASRHSEPKQLTHKWHRSEKAVKHLHGTNPFHARFRSPLLTFALSSAISIGPREKSPPLAFSVNPRR